MSEIRRSMQPIAELCGFEVAQELVRVWGGIRVYIPISGKNSHMDGLSDIAKERLCKYFPGDYFEVPKTLLNDPGETRRLALQMAREGISVEEIAKNLEVTQRWIYKILQSNPEYRRNNQLDERQIDLEDWLNN